MKYLDKKIVRIGVAVAIIILGIIAVVVQNASSDKPKAINKKVATVSSTTFNNNAKNTSLQKQQQECKDQKEEVNVAQTEGKDNNQNNQVSNDKETTSVCPNQEKDNQNVNTNDQQVSSPVSQDNSSNQTSQNNSGNNVSQKLTLTGYLIDEDCLIPYPDPAEETRGCLTMPECAASGYGIAVKENGKYVFYYFDGNISTVSEGNRVENATDGQQLAWNYIDQEIVSNNVQVTVTGTLTGNKRTNPYADTADGKYYPELKVESIG